MGYFEERTKIMTALKCEMDSKKAAEVRNALRNLKELAYEELKNPEKELMSVYQEFDQTLFNATTNNEFKYSEKLDRVNELKGAIIAQPLDEDTSSKVDALAFRLMGELKACSNNTVLKDTKIKNALKTREGCLALLRVPNIEEHAKSLDLKRALDGSKSKEEKEQERLNKVELDNTNRELVAIYKESRALRQIKDLFSLERKEVSNKLKQMEAEDSQNYYVAD